MEKIKKINRIDLVNYLVGLTKSDKFIQETFAGKNFYYLTKDNETVYELEFIPASKRYFTTLRFRGYFKEADEFNQSICDYVSNLKLGRNICIDTEYKTKLV